LNIEDTKLSPPATTKPPKKKVNGNGTSLREGKTMTSQKGRSTDTENLKANCKPLKLANEKRGKGASKFEDSPAEGRTKCVKGGKKKRQGRRRGKKRLPTSQRT